MNSILKLSLKNLARHKKRTIITSIAIAFGVAMLLWTHSILKWADNESRRNLKKYEYGTFIISTKKYAVDRENYPVKHYIKKDVLNKILTITKKMNIKTTARTGFQSIVSYNRGFGLPYVLYSINPADDANVFYIHEEIVAGHYLENDSKGIMISSMCQKEFNVELGDYLSIETRTKYGTYQALKIPVIGIFNCPNPIVNKNYIFIAQEYAEDNLQLEETATEIACITDNGKIVPAFTKLKSKLHDENLDNITIKTWKDLGADYLTLSETKKGGSKIIILFIFVIVAVGIVNTMLMAVFERFREIGTLRALGMRDKDIIISFIYESAGIGLIGSIAGIIIGVIINIYMINVGLDFSAAMKDVDIGYRTGTVFYGEWNPEMMLIALIFGIVCSVVVSIIPARKAIDMEITDSIRYI